MNIETRKANETNKESAVPVCKPYKLVLWDFDGTLCDTSKGIFRSLRQAFAEMGMTEPPLELLQKFIGPPLLHTLEREMGILGQSAEEIVRRFREVYQSEGIYESEIFPGIEALINRLHVSGVKNAVATLKPQFMAAILLQHFGLAHLIDDCSGAPSDEKLRITKAQTIEAAMEHVGITDRRDAVMIGDTVFDEQGAREAGVDFIAVSYGFGITESAANSLDCLFLARNAEEIENFLFSGN